MSALKEHFSLLRGFLRSGFRISILLSTAGFFAAGIAGYFIGTNSPETVESVIGYFMATVEQSGVIEDDGSISTFALLANNWSAMLVSVLYGLIPFAFLPVSSLLINGFILGITGAMYQSYGQTLALWLSALLPHGIFEIPALILSIACGVYLCVQISKLILRYPNRAPMLEVFCNVLRVMLLLVAPLTIAAAFVEAYITPVIMSFFI